MGLRDGAHFARGIGVEAGSGVVARARAAPVTVVVAVMALVDVGLAGEGSIHQVTLGVVVVVVRRVVAKVSETVEAG